MYPCVVTPGFWLSLGVVAAGGAGCWYVVVKARRQAEQVHREAERLKAEVEKMRQALEEERSRQRLEYDPPENVVDFWRH